MNKLKDIHNWYACPLSCSALFCQDFNEQIEGYTQPPQLRQTGAWGCFVRISMNKLKDIHNWFCWFGSLWCVVLSGFQWTILKDIHNPGHCWMTVKVVVLSGFQWTILLQKYRKNGKYANLQEIILIFQKKALPLQQQFWRIYTIRIIPLCKHSEWHACVSLFFILLKKSSLK